ncbi:hypothetical protein V5O48_004132 [Marasmius crinis-equi]|uniref:Uncharacterized protein n=1 Tax=Marasmius crinis-equi TaxID=585013 RepID=A0ABR3FR07_9AGAR
MSSGSSSSQLLPSSSSTHIVSKTLKNAQQFSIGDNSNLSTIHGDQHNHYNTGTEVKKRRFIVGTEEEEAEYAEFPEIRRGEFMAIRTIYCSDISLYDSKQQKYVKRGERMAVVGDVRVGGVGSRCTVMQYNGQGAEEMPRKRSTGGNQPLEYPDAHTYRKYVLDICVRSVTDGMADLVPLAHLFYEVGRLGRVYVRTLQRQMGCRDRWLWMDTSRGVFCRGPEGPWCHRPEIDHFDCTDLPLDAELIKEDVLIRYLASRKQDRVVVDGLSRAWSGGFSRIEVYRPMVISTLTDTVLALGSGFWEDEWSCLGGREELANGAIRFTLKHGGRRLVLRSDCKESRCDWLAQAPSIFHAHGIPLEGNMNRYQLILPELKGMLSDSKAEQRRREECPPIYLFIPPLSTSIFWSFNPDGQNPVNADRCHFFGLPTSLSLKCTMWSWQTETYKSLQTYQIARGFGLNTTEFVRHNGYHMYEIVKRPLINRFEEFNKNSEPTEKSEAELPEELDDIKPGGPPANNPMTQEAKAWSRFVPTFSWAALENSDIHAAGF